jgi:N-acetylmuramoyl-L-alanine amidase
MQAITPEQAGLNSRRAMESYTVRFRLLRGACFFALLLFMLAGKVRAGDWDIVKHEGRDYVTVASLAKFYGFPQPVPAASQMAAPDPANPLTKQLLLDNGKHQVLLILNSRLAVIDGVNQWLGFPTAVEGDQLLLSRLDLAKMIEPSLRPELIGGLNPVDTVVLDPGHGGHDKGAVCIFGNEKDFALDVCYRAKSLLEAKGVRVLMTRKDDTFIPLEQRPTVANATPNSVFVAIHFNDSGNPDANGFEIYSITPRGEPSTADNTMALHDLATEPGNATDVQSEALSESIYHSLLGNIPNVDRGIKHARFAVIRLAQVPAVLIEGGFVSSYSEARKIATPAYRQLLAESVVTGILGFKTLAEHRIPPKLVADYRHEANPGMQSAPVVVTNAPDPSAPEGVDSQTKTPSATQ